MPTPTLLHIDASPRGARSKGRQLGRAFVTRWRDARQSSTRVITRDVGTEPPPFVTEAWVEGAFAPPEAQSNEARLAIAVSDAYVDELLVADELLITTPIYNLSLPAALKAWIDQVVRAGRTFGFKDGTYHGLVHNKRAVVVVTSGGDPRPETPGGAYNFLEPYVRAVLGFIGITSVDFVYAHSLSSEAVSEQTLAQADAQLAAFVRAA